MDVHPHIGDHAQLDPDRPAIVMSDGSPGLTFAELDSTSQRLAAQLSGLGVAAEEHVAILMGNRPQFLVAAWAAQRSGLTYTPVNWHLTAEESAYIVRDCAARVLLTALEHRELAEAVAATVPNLVLLFADESGRFVDAAQNAPPEAPYQEREGQMLVYSSGTSGLPKGIERKMQYQPFGTLNASDTLLRGVYGFRHGMVLLMPAPLYHTAPCAWSVSALRVGGTVVLMRRFDPQDMLTAIAHHGVTHMWSVATMFIRLLRLPQTARTNADLSSLEKVIHSAAPCPVDVKHQMIAWLGPRIYEFYAASEGNGFVAIDSAQWLEHPGSVGRSDAVRILDDEGRQLPAGEVGQVYFTTGLVNFEYRHDEAKTQDSRSAEGWTTVGDVGYVDEDGWLFLTDRKSHMIISGGVNIYPQEAENVLAAHPDVLDVAVIGIPHAEYGEEVRGVVQLMPGVATNEAKAAELIAYCTTRLARYKCPRRIDFTDELPRLPTGKLMKRLLKDRYPAS